MTLHLIVLQFPDPECGDKYTHLSGQNNNNKTTINKPHEKDSYKEAY